MTFKKPFLCCDNDELRCKVIPQWNETQKLGLQHGHWTYSIEYLKSRKQKKEEKTNRYFQNILNKGKALADAKNVSLAISEKER